MTAAASPGRGRPPAAAGPGAADVDVVQRHAVRALAVSQAPGGVGVSSGIAVSALVARDVSGSETLAGLAQTGQVLGAAVIAAVDVGRGGAAYASGGAGGSRGPPAGRPFSKISRKERPVSGISRHSSKILREVAKEG